VCLFYYISILFLSDSCELEKILTTEYCRYPRKEYFTPCHNWWCWHWGVEEAKGSSESEEARVEKEEGWEEELSHLQHLKRSRWADPRRGEGAHWQIASGYKHITRQFVSRAREAKFSLQRYSFVCLFVIPFWFSQYPFTMFTRTWILPATTISTKIYHKLKKWMTWIVSCLFV
jgi:hypothetical protein